VIAGSLLFVASAGMLMGFITGEAVYPAEYSTSENTISDLGGTLPPDSIMLEPSRTIFIATMLVAGIMILAAAFFSHRALHRRGFTIALTAFGIGVVGVGVFPGNTGTPHILLSMVAFLGGAIAAIASRRVAEGPLRVIAVTLGVTALVSTFLGIDQFVDWGPGAVLGVGGMERWIAYPVLLWMACFGGYLMGGASHARPRVRSVTTV